jgi:hypothetical protein
VRIRLGLGFVDVVLFLIVELWLEYDLRRCEWLGLFVCWLKGERERVRVRVLCRAMPQF